MPAGSAPKAALIDKVRIALQHVDDITDDVMSTCPHFTTPTQTSYLSHEALKHNVHFC